MRIHLVGSVPDNDYDRTPEAIERGLKKFPLFFSAAAQIGRVAAEHGHTLMVGSEFPLTIDHHAVLKGLIPVLKTKPKQTFYLEVWRPNDKNRPYDELRSKYDNLKVDYFVRRPSFPLQHRRNPHTSTVNTGLWMFAHQSALANADVLLAMGGTEGTERAVYAAEQLGIPTLPLQCFGGGAGRACQALEFRLINLPNADILSANWSKRRANDIIELAERIGTHSYFISYSHVHVEWCDLVHLALYTRGRVVLRDRGELSVGRSVQDKIMETIGKGETFILLWSKEASQSKWCREELKHALALHEAGLPPRRIVMLRRDETPPPRALKNLLWLEARDRRQTDDAVNRIVADESVR